MTNISNVLETPDITPINTETSIEGLTYETSMVSKSLGVQESTLRKYCALMKQNNYEFNTNAAGHRIFYKKDIDTIRMIVDLKNSSALTLNQSVKTVLESDIDNISEDNTNAAEPFSNTVLVEAFKSFKQEQVEFNQKLIIEIQKHQEYIEDSIKERDRKLMYVIKESMETRRQLAASEVEREIVKKKAKWWQFWK